MCFFKKWRKRRLDKKLAKGTYAYAKNTPNVASEEKAQNKDLDPQLTKKITEINKNEPVKKQDSDNPEVVEKLKIRPFSKPSVSNKSEPEWPKKEVMVDETKKVKKVESNNNGRKYEGKYEIYPEAGYYKFRLKASNGEILCVSFRYSSEKGAISGIDTFKKNVVEGQFNVVTDKNNFSQFQLYNVSGARAIIFGELYQSVQRANSALESLKSFYKTNKVEVLKSIPQSEVREEVIEYDSVEGSNKGKFELYKEEGLHYIRLRASNAQILMVSQGYASKASAKSGFNTIQNAIMEKNFTVSRDKQNRYQFNLYSSNGQLIVAGETYPVKASAVSAAHSVLKFGLKSPLVEL